MKQQLAFQDYNALLGGSFDPFHKGHLHIAQQILRNTAVKSVVFLPCGHHNFKQDSIRQDFETRLRLIQKSIQNIPGLVAWDEDAESKGSGFTADLMRRLYTRFPDERFCFVVGSDNVKNLPKWYNFAWLRDRVEFLVVPRPGYEAEEEVMSMINASIIPIPLSDISSATIRSRIEGDLPVSGMLPPAIESDVIQLYKKAQLI